MLDDPNKALDKYQGILQATGSAARDGKRLARYFNMLARKKLKESPDPRSRCKLISSNRPEAGCSAYPNYTRTPEGYGVQYWLATFLLEEAENPKIGKRFQSQLATEARKYLSNIEHTENEFTDRAKRLKIDAMDKQGTFKQTIDKLRTFEDCYVRAQYEQMQIAEDVKQAKDNESQEEKERKQRFANIIQALQAGLKKPDAKDFPIEFNNARALLTFYLLEEGKYKEAIEVGEAFARKDASSQAASAAIYALVAYGQAAGRTRTQSPRCPNAATGTILSRTRRAHARAGPLHGRSLAERAGRQPRATTRSPCTCCARKKIPRPSRNWPASRRPILPTSARNIFSPAPLSSKRHQDKDKGDPQGYYKRALAALNTLPAPTATADVETNNDYVQAKLLLGLELVKSKKLKEVDAVLAALAPKLTSLKVDDDPEKEKEKHRKFQDGMVQLSLYSAALQADAEFKAAKYKAVAQRLDPLVDKFNADKLPQLKESGLAPSLIGSRFAGECAGE